MDLSLRLGYPYCGKGAGSPPAPVLAAARFQGDAQYARSPTMTVGSVGATNFEVQALVYLEGARLPGERIFMVQFPASRQAGLFASQFDDFPLTVGDSQVGSIGGELTSDPATGKWYLMTFSADGSTAGVGLWKGSIQAVDGSLGYTTCSKVKGVENSLTGNRIDLNGGGVDDGWTNGIRYAEVRAYASQRSDAQRQADLTNTDPTGALFWWRFTDNGGAVAVEDRTGNGVLPTIVGATVATGPTL